MKIEISEILNGNYNNQIVYICDIRDNGNPFEKLIRHVEPKRVMIRHNDEITSNKKIYYSNYHFVELNKNDEPLKSKIHGVFDNTGHRSYTGVPLQVFSTEIEAKNHYIQMKELIKEKMKNKIEQLVEKMESF